MSESPFVRKRMSQMKAEKAEQDFARLIDEQSQKMQEELDKKVIEILRNLDYDISDKPTHEELERLRQEMERDQIAIKFEHEPTPPEIGEDGVTRSQLITRIRVEYVADVISVDLEINPEEE